MIGTERRRGMWLIREAQAGNPDAFEPLVSLIDAHFWNPRQFNCPDPAFDIDDIHQWFRIGVWRAILVVDGRGSPLFHLAERGRWHTCAMLAMKYRQRRGGDAWVRDFGEPVSIGTLSAEGETTDRWLAMADPRPESDPAYAVEISEQRDEARQTIIRVIANTPLRPRDHDVIDWLMTDPDPFELGANQRLAKRLDVSEQRASKLRQRCIDALADHAAV